MERRQRQNSDDDHCALKNHERDFLVGERTIKALAQLGNTEDGSDEDGEGSESEG